MRPTSLSHWSKAHSTSLDSAVIKVGSDTKPVTRPEGGILYASGCKVRFAKTNRQLIVVHSGREIL